MSARTKKKTAADALLVRARGVARAPKNLTVLEWAERERRLGRGVSSVEGKFRALPYQRLLLEVITQRRYSEHIWMIAAQTVKTESLNCVIGYFVDEEPCGIMVVYPTLDGAKAYSKKKLARMIAGTPALRKKFAAARSRDSGNTVLSKEFVGGDIILAGSNSPATLRGPSRRLIIQDEIDSYEVSAGSEGDPCALADNRGESFANAIYIKASTPTIRGKSRIEEKFEDSTRHRFHVPCPKCRAMQWLKWKQVQWPDGKTEEAKYICEVEACKAEWTDAERIRAIHAGRWIPEQADHRRFGAQMSGLYRLIGLKDTYRSFLHEFASVFLDRKHAGPFALRAWQNTFLAETYEEDAEKIDPSEVIERAEEYTPDELPGDVLVLVAGGDVQKDRIELTVFAFGKDEESWGVQKIVFDGDPEKDEVWAAVDAALLTEFRRADGVPLKIERAFFDMGFKSTRVLSFCAPRLGRGIYPCRGLNRVGVNIPPVLPPKVSRNNRARVPHWNVGVTVAKTTIYDRLQLPVPGARSMHFPVGFGFDADYFKQLTSEHRKTRYSYGVAYSIFEKPNAAVRNEALDCNVYALGALYSLLPIAWTKRAEALKKLAPPPVGPEHETEEDKPEAQVVSKPVKPARPQRPQRRNWATSW